MWQFSYSSAVTVVILVTLGVTDAYAYDNTAVVEFVGTDKDLRIIPFRNYSTSSQSWGASVFNISLNLSSNLTTMISFTSDLNALGVTHVIARHSPVLHYILQTANVTYVVTSRPQGRTAGGRVLQVLPAAEDLARCVSALLTRLAWRRYAVLYERQYTDVLTRLTGGGGGVHLWKLEPDTGIRSIITALRNLSIHQVLVLADEPVTSSMLTQARLAGLLGRPHAWLLLHLSGARLSPSILQYLHTDVTTVEFYGANAAVNNMSLTERGTAEALKYTVAPLTRGQGNDTSADLSSSGPHFTSDGARTRYSLRLFNYRHNDKQPVGSYHVGPNSSLVWNPQAASVVTKQQSLRGSHIRVVTIIEEPFVYYKQDAEKRKGNNKFQGFGVDVMDRLAAVLEFKYDLYLVHDGQFGALQADGTWNGLIGDVLRGNASMTIAPLTINADREAAIDFTKPFKTRGITMLMRTPVSKTSFFQFMEPLSDGVWACVLLCFLILSVLLYLMESHSRHIRSDMTSFNFLESIWFIWGALVGGSTETSPVTVPGRVLSSAWWLFSLILISTYTANLAAFLTVKKISPPVSSVEDLVKQTALQFGTVRNSGVMMFFKNARVEPYRTVWEQLQSFKPDNMVDNTTQGIQRVLSGNYAFLWDNTVNSYRAAKDCQLTEVGRPFDPKGFGIGMPPGSTYREELSLELLRLGDQGIITELSSRYWMDSRCPGAAEPDLAGSAEVTLEHLGGIFGVLLGGAVLACLVLAAERWVVLWLRRRRKDKAAAGAEEGRPCNNSLTIQDK